MKKANKQSGNAILVVIVILTVVLVGFLGYIFYQSSNQPKPVAVVDQPVSTTIPTTTETPIDNTVIVPETVVDPISSNDPNALTITGWNIKGLYTGSHMVNYQIISSNYIQFTSDDLTGSCADYKLGFIYRRAGDQLIASVGEFGFDNTLKDTTVSQYYAQADANAKANIKHIGSYYYIYVSPQAPCSSDGVAPAISSDVFGYFKTLQAV